MSEKPTTELAESDKKIELLEERAVIHKEKIKIADLHIRKVIKQKTVNVPVTLSEEVLIIDCQYPDERSKKILTEDNADAILYDDNINTDSSQIIINGENVQLNDLPYEITIAREVAKVVKETYAVEEIAIASQTKTKKGHIEVGLRHEELEIDKLKD